MAISRMAGNFLVEKWNRVKLANRLLLANSKKNLPSM
jgi:hypothetical protein